MAFNTLAGVTLVAGVVEFFLVLESPELKSISGSLQFIVLGAVGWWNLFLAGICLAVAQVLRLLADIAVAVSDPGKADRVDLMRS